MIRPVFLLLCIAFLGASGPAGDEAPYPLESARLLAEGLTESCAICVKGLREEAFSIIEKTYPPGKIIEATAGRPFVRDPGGQSAFLIAGHEKRVLIRKDPKKGDIYLPLFLFRFHTAGDHLVGVERANYTDQKTAKKFTSTPPGGLFQGKAVIIGFQYGDGPSFTYSVADNIIYIHCRLEFLVRGSGKKLEQTP